jgi:hypothetical protein
VLLALGVVSMVSLIVAGATSLITLADKIHPVAGTVVFWGLCLAAGFLALYGVIAYAQLPPALVPPKETSGPEHEAYLQTLRSRLANNPRTRGLPLGTDAEVETAIAHLSKEADLVVRRTASTVFLSTALMQNGRLDGLIVLFTQIQMVGRIARIYVQRPSPRELLRLYANVGGTAFVASSLESLDLGEMVAPLAVSVVPALKSGIPGLRHFSAPGEMRFKRRGERVPHITRGRSRTALLRTHIASFTGSHPEICYCRGRPASRANCSRKWRAGCEKDLGKYWTRIDRKRRVESRRHRRRHA